MPTCDLLSRCITLNTSHAFGGPGVLSIDKDLLTILCCPETKQPVSLAEAALIQKINAAVTRGEVTNKGMKPVSALLEGGLIREDRQILYPIRSHIPTLLIEEGIPLEQVLD